MRHTIGAVFTNKEVTAHTSKEDMAISQTPEAEESWPKLKSFKNSLQVKIFL